jgi:small GTP-binding protein
LTAINRGRKMGTAFSEPREYSMGLLGLSEAGKTCILYRLTLNEFVSVTIPTIGINVESLLHNGIKFTCYDIGSTHFHRRIRLRSNALGSDVILFVVDSSDKTRIEEACNELRKVDSEAVEKAQILVIANKQDLTDVMSVTEITTALRLSQMKRNWYVVPCSAVTGGGLDIALDWMDKNLK